MHDESAGEQRHQSQHRKVDPIGPRQVGHALRAGLRRGPGGIGRQSGCPLPGQGGRIDPGRQAQVNAGEPAQPAQSPLRGADVHHAQGLAGRRTGHGAGDLQSHGTQADPYRYGLADPDPPRGQRRGAEEERVVGEHTRGRALAVALGQQAGGDLGGPHDVDSDDPQRLSVQQRRAFDDRTGGGDPGVGEHGVIQRFGHAVAARHEAGVGLAIDDRQGIAELGQRTAVDEFDRQAERYPDRDGQNRGGQAARLGAPLSGQQPSDQGRGGRSRIARRVAAAARSVGSRISQVHAIRVHRAQAAGRTPPPPAASA
jgi:hypothetical protein